MFGNGFLLIEFIARTMCYASTGSASGTSRIRRGHNLIPDRIPACQVKAEKRRLEALEGCNMLELIAHINIESFFKE